MRTQIIHVSIIQCEDCCGRGIQPLEPDRIEACRDWEGRWTINCPSCQGEGEIEIVETDDQYRERTSRYEMVA